MLALPGHTTHEYQPLDKCIFGPVSTAFKRSEGLYCDEKDYERHRVNENWSF